MNTLKKTCTAIVTAAALALGSSVACAQDYYVDSLDSAPSGEAMAFDMVVVRPLALAATVLGVGVFVLQLPISLITWNFKDPAQRLVVEPARYTFTRELGRHD
jgi:hypothetical protein